MNIIERAVNRLASEPQAPLPVAVNEKAAAKVKAADGIGNDIPPVKPQMKQVGVTGATDLKRPVAPATGESRVIKLDMENLKSRRVITPDTGRSPITENFRRVKRHILANVANPEAPPGANLIMITSALPGEGKTFCAVNLAMSIAMEIDLTVLLVDADVAKPSAMPLLGINAEGELGLMDVLLDPKIKLPDVLLRTDIGKLSVLPAGRPHPRATEMLASESMKALLQDLAERYRDRIIIFDSPPLLATSEACVLAGLMGQIIVVVESGKTTELALKDALSRISSKASIGMLLNKGVESGHSEYGDGYGYGYG